MVAESQDAAARSDASSEAVRVAVRVRPLSIGETAQGSAACADVKDSSVLLAEKKFHFNAAFPPATQQDQVYSSLVAPMVQQFFDGYNATVFAYGQTGSGKTYTMGNEFASNVLPKDRGIIPRVMDAVFDKVQASTNKRNIVVKLSYLEVLNEEVRDLLAASDDGTAALSVLGDGERGIVISGLSEYVVTSADQAAKLLRSGAQGRATASTSMNAQSSRSHAICTITMKQQDVVLVGGGRETRSSKFHLVDLAGSERVRRTNSHGARFKEGVNINRGLLALGNVINALCERNRTSTPAHVPYRASKMTRLLQDSLGGNSKTLMIACISPADINYEETSNTLRYASRALNIENQAVVNKERDAEGELAFLKQQLEIAQLQLLQQPRRIGSDRIGCQDSDVCGSLLGDLQEENRKLREELIQANSAKDKWEKIATDLTPQAKMNQSATSTPVRNAPQSRLEQLRTFQSQRTKSKDGVLSKRKGEDITTPNKYRRTLSSPKTDQAGGGGQSIGDVMKHLQHVMASQDSICTAKVAIQVNLDERKSLALKISLLEATLSTENTEKLAKLQSALKDKTTRIGLLQQELVRMEKNASLPLGLLPVRIDTCHQLIRHLIDVLMESKEECAALSRCRSELDAARKKIVEQRKNHKAGLTALTTRLEETLKEIQTLREQGVKKKPKKSKARESYETLETLLSSSDEEEDDSGADSDYIDEQERRQRLNKKANRRAPSSSTNSDIMGEIDKLLETSSASCCSCHGKCATKACACKSQDRVCGSDCSCSPDKCLNASKNDDEQRAEISDSKEGRATHRIPSTSERKTTVLATTPPRSNE